MLDSILATTPVSSPLHPQAGLPLLKGYLESRGFNTKIIDTNILFYHWFLDGYEFNLAAKDVYGKPIKILAAYDDMEKKLWEKSQAYDGLAVGLRYLNLKYERTRFDDVIASVEDKKAIRLLHFTMK